MAHVFSVYKDITSSLTLLTDNRIPEKKVLMMKVRGRDGAEGTD